MMSTEKSLKHLKSKDEFLVANVSNYFEKHSGGTAHHIFNILFRRLGVFRVRKELRETSTLSSQQSLKRGQ